LAKKAARVTAVDFIEKFVEKNLILYMVVLQNLSFKEMGNF
jgi:hypothetical protein